MDRKGRRTSADALSLTRCDPRGRRTLPGCGRARPRKGDEGCSRRHRDEQGRRRLLALLGLASRRPWSCTRARVLLTNGPDARGWSGDRRRWYSRASRPARPWSQPPPPPPPPPPFLALQTPPRHSQVFLLSNLPFCAPPQPAKRGFAPMAGGRLEGAEGASRTLTNPGVGHRLEKVPKLTRTPACQRAGGGTQPV